MIIAIRRILPIHAAEARGSWGKDAGCRGPGGSWALRPIPAEPDRVSATRGPGDLWPQIESSHREMTIEGEGALDAVMPHESEGSAIGEADALIREFLEQCQRLAILTLAGPQNRKRPRVKDVARPLGRECIARSAREKREGLRQDQVAGESRGALPGEPIPSGDGLRVRPILRDVARQEGARIDEDHSGSP